MQNRLVPIIIFCTLLLSRTSLALRGMSSSALGQHIIRIEACLTQDIRIPYIQEILQEHINALKGTAFEAFALEYEKIIEEMYKKYKAETPVPTPPVVDEQPLIIAEESDEQETPHADDQEPESPLLEPVAMPIEPYSDSSSTTSADTTVEEIIPVEQIAEPEQTVLPPAVDESPVEELEDEPTPCTDANENRPFNLRTTMIPLQILNPELSDDTIITNDTQSETPAPTPPAVDEPPLAMTEKSDEQETVETVVSIDMSSEAHSDHSCTTSADTVAEIIPVEQSQKIHHTPLEQAALDASSYQQAFALIDNAMKMAEQTLFHNKAQLQEERDILTKAYDKLIAQQLTAAAHAINTTTDQLRAFYNAQQYTIADFSLHEPLPSDLTYAQVIDYAAFTSTNRITIITMLSKISVALEELNQSLITQYLLKHPRTELALKHHHDRTKGTPEGAYFVESLQKLVACLMLFKDPVTEYTTHYKAYNYPNVWLACIGIQLDTILLIVQQIQITCAQPLSMNPTSGPYPTFGMKPHAGTPTVNTKKSRLKKPQRFSEKK